MNASVNEPFVLSTHNVASMLLTDYETHLFATHAIQPNSSDGLVTVTAQGDGIHVFDLASLHSISSRSLGPSTTFSCPAISKVLQSGGTKTCFTYAVIASSSELSAEDYDRTLWCWSEVLNNSLPSQGSTQRTAVSTSHPIARLLPHTEGVFLVFRSGSIDLLSPNAKDPHPLWSPPSPTFLLLDIFSFAADECEFLPSLHSATGTIAVLFLASEESSDIAVFILAVDSSSLVTVGHCTLPAGNGQLPVAITCSNSGHVSVLEFDGAWTLYQLEGGDEYSLVSQHATHLSTHLLTISNATSLALTSSHVLLVAPSQVTPEIHIAIWDLKFGIVLDAYVLPLSASLAGLPRTSLHLTLSHTSTRQAILTLSPAPTPHGNDTKESTKGRSSVLVIPYSCPASSTLLNAIGKAPQTRKWLQQDAPEAAKPPQLHSSQVQLLDVMKKSMENNNPNAATTAFFEWESHEKGKISQSTFAYGHEFMRKTMEIMLQPSRQGTTPYSAKLTHHLITKKLVNSTLLGGDLLPALRLRNDWKGIELALRNILDLSEMEIMDTLRCLLSKTSPSSSAMDIDQEPTPTLPHFLHLMVCHPACSTVSTALCQAIKTHISQREHILEVLQIIENWLGRSVIKDSSLITPQEATRTSRSGITPVHGDIPPLSRILPFLTTLMDASFLHLLPSPQATGILKRLQAHLDTHTKAFETSLCLKGALEPFVALMGMRDGEENVSGEDWRQRRKKAQELAVADVGVYRYEEITL